jgi:hypothetical protein
MWEGLAGESFASPLLKKNTPISSVFFFFFCGGLLF